MKSLFRKTFALVLAAGVFITTVGVTVFKHECHASQTSNVSIYVASKCCPDEKKTGEDDDCCETTVTLSQSQDEKRVPEIFSLTALGASSGIGIVNPEFPFLSEEANSSSWFRPPARAGTFILVKNQVFRV